MFMDDQHENLSIISDKQLSHKMKYGPVNKDILGHKLINSLCVSDQLENCDNMNQFPYMDNFVPRSVLICMH